MNVKKGAKHDRHFTIPLTKEQRALVKKAAAKEALPDAMWARRVLVKAAGTETEP